MANLIEYDAVRKIYNSGEDEVVALEEVSFQVSEGEFVTVVGRSGCGKSTLLKITSGLLPATAGAVRVGGAMVRGPLTNIGVVFQAPVLLAWRKALDNVLLQIEARGLNVAAYRKRALELLELTGLKGFEGKYPNELSGGMQQRVSISRALIHDPPLLLMDEPFGALDAITRDEMNLELLRIWQEAKKTLLFITHSIPEAVFLGDRVVVMTPRPGKVAEIIPIDLPRPRVTGVRDDPKFIGYVRKIRERLGVQ
ncbi:MAG TPA: ABC transporter ATP-binding protein [Candidatus Binatia bacterium]|nr:ABC transporter ATP-binding protein [Candidatus Binatia bacterium]